MLQAELMTQLISQLVNQSYLIVGGPTKKERKIFRIFALFLFIINKNQIFFINNKILTKKYL